MTQVSPISVSQLRPWPKFPTYQDVQTFAQQFEGGDWEEALRGMLGSEILEDRPFIPDHFNETRHPFFAELNNLLRLTSSSPKTSVVNDNHIEIGPARNAKLCRPGSTNHDSPEFGAYWTDGRYPRTGPSDRSAPPAKPQEVPCLMAGEYRHSREFKYSHIAGFLLSDFERILRNQLGDYMDQHGINDGFLGKTGETFQRGDLKEPVGDVPTVINQVYDYMDMHHNRYGYVMNEAELIMFRRREDKGRMLLDVSGPIQIHKEPETLNATMVLWYFHVKYAALNKTGWYMSSSHGTTVKLGSK